MPGETGRPLLELVEARRDDIKAIVARHHGRSVASFGSVARGEEHIGSDLDVLVELEPEARPFEILTIGAGAPAPGYDRRPETPTRDRTRPETPRPIWQQSPEGGTKQAGPERPAVGPGRGGGNATRFDSKTGILCPRTSHLAAELSGG